MTGKRAVNQVDGFVNRIFPFIARSVGRRQFTSLQLNDPTLQHFLV